MNDVADGTGADLVLCMNRVRGFSVPCGGATEDVLSSADSYGCLVERLATLSP